MGRGRIELRGVGAAEPADVAGVFDDRALHAQDRCRVGYAALASIPDGFDLALDAAVAEAAGHEDALDVGELGGRPVPSMCSASTQDTSTRQSLAMRRG